MRPAFSFWLSLLMLATVLGVQVVAMSAPQESRVVAVNYNFDEPALEWGVDVLQEFEDEVEVGALSFTIHRPHRTLAINQAQEDRFELFGPPDEVEVGVVQAWVDPQAHAVYSCYVFLDEIMRPPSRLQQSGAMERA